MADTAAATKDRAPVNIETASLVKRTRWHPTPDQLVLNGVGAKTVGEAMRSDASVFPVGKATPFDDPDQARTALKDADARLLLMSVMHLTADEALLDRFSPYIGAQFAGGAKGVQSHAIPPEMHDELIDILVDKLSGRESVDEQPISGRLALKMMSVCAGEPVNHEFLALLLEQCGFTGIQGVDDSHHEPAPEGFKIVIVGAGLTGMALGVRLKQLGYDFEIFEDTDNVGGTWHKNRYPGVGVDTPSHYYSYSWEINPDWPKWFSKADVLRNYLRGIAEKYDLIPHINFRTPVRSATYDETLCKWRVLAESPDGTTREVIANVFVPAVSQTNNPMVPDIEGMSSFKGVMQHTAQWDESVDLTGKRVAVIGTGATSMQLCTTISPDVAQLTIYQRSKHWIVPTPQAHQPVPDGARWAMRYIPHYAQWQRFISYWTGSDGTYASAVIDPEWKDQHLSVSPANERRRKFFLAHIDKELADRPDLKAAVTPDYPPGGKRIVLDSGWLTMLKQDHVRIQNTRIARITETGIETVDGEHVEFDIIVLATGFAFRPMMATFDVIGKGGKRISEVWGDDPRAYMGVLIPDFPNLFMMNGPNGGATHGAGHNLMSESSTIYISGLLDIMARTGAKTIEPQMEAYEEFNAVVDEQLSRMIWSHPLSKSYYLNSKRRNTVSSPWRLVDQWGIMRKPVESDLVLG